MAAKSRQAGSLRSSDATDHALLGQLRPSPAEPCSKQPAEPKP